MKCLNLNHLTSQPGQKHVLCSSGGYSLNKTQRFVKKKSKQWCGDEQSVKLHFSSNFMLHKDMVLLSGKYR